MKTSTLILASVVATGAIGLACTGAVPDTCEYLKLCQADGGAWPADDGSAPPNDADGASDAEGIPADAQADTGEPGEAGTGDDGGGNADAADSAPTCDPTKTPAEDNCVISDALAIFVSSATGTDSNAGTLEAPVKTIAKGIALAQATSNHRVIVEPGTYAESVSLTTTTAAAGVSIFGGVQCLGSDAGVTTCRYVGTKAVVAPASSAAGSVGALGVIGVVQPVLLADLEVDAPPVGTTAGTSSIAAEVSGATAGVTFVRCTLNALAGVTGAPGKTPPGTIATGTNGNNADSATNDGGAPITCACPNGVPSIGGAGGVGAALATETATGGEEGSPLLKANNGGAGTSTGGACGVGTAGQGGATGNDGPSPTTNATLVDGVWTPTAGANGGYGATGQGGGGGGGGYGPTPPDGNGGGGGACGGCGGNGGTGGGGGGSSIALLAIQSAVTFQSCTLTTKAAAAGGSGAGGQGGGGGGVRGIASTGNGCQGGNGGVGGTGGAAAGGAGGVSVGVVYQGAAPTLDPATTVTAGALGAGGTGGDTPKNDGPPGVSQATLSLP